MSVKRIWELVRNEKLKLLDFAGRTYVSWKEVRQRCDDEVKAGERIKRSLRQERRKRRVLSIEELTSLVAVSKSRGFVYAFAFYTGIRRNELANLLVTDLQKKEGNCMVTVRAAISKIANRCCCPFTMR